MPEHDAGNKFRLFLLPVGKRITSNVADSLVRLGQLCSSEVPPVPCKVHSYRHVCLRYQLCEKPALDMWLIAYIVCTAQGLHKWMGIGTELRAAQVVTGILASTERKGNY